MLSVGGERSLYNTVRHHVTASNMNDNEITCTVQYCIDPVEMHYHQTSTAAVSSYDRNVRCLGAKSYKMVHVFMIHISHL